MAATSPAMRSGWEDQREVDGGADGDEEEAEQQALKGSMSPPARAVFAVGEDDTGEQRAVRRRQADRGHQQRDPDDQQQGGGGEDLAQARAGDLPEQRSEHEAPAGDDERHRAEHGQGLAPGRQAGHQRDGVLGFAMPGRAIAGRQQRNSASMGSPRCPEQQHGKGALATGRAEQAFSLSVCSTMAVDDSESVMPTAAAACHGRPTSSAPVATASVVMTTCRPPKPRIGARSVQSIAGSSSSPMTKSIITTPNSAKCMTSCPPVPSSDRPKGPMATPASR